MRTAAILSALLALSMLVPAAQAHAAPAARDFETRALHDHNDDSLYSLAGEHGFDTIALDLREGHLPDGQPALIFRLLLNGGCNDSLEAMTPCGDLQLDVEFSSGSAQTVSFITSDGGATWGGSAPFYFGPEGINDGERFAIEAWVPMGELGVAQGSTLSGFFVSAADNMPEGLAPGQPDPLDAAFELDSYTVGSPNKYLQASATELELHDGQATFNLTNLVTANQMVSFSGATVMRGDVELTDLELAANFVETLTVLADDDATLVITSTVGGYQAVALSAPHHMPGPGGSVLSPDVLPGESWSHTFTGVGMFSYHNHHMPEAEGMLKITGGNALASHTVTWTGSAFEPAHLDIQTGDMVTWINNGTEPLIIMGSTNSSGHDHDDGHHDHGDSADVPGVGLVALLAALAAGFALRRRA